MGAPLPAEGSRTSTAPTPRIPRRGTHIVSAPGARRRTRVVAGLGVGALVLALLAGCGTDAAPTPAATPTSGTAAPPAPKKPISVPTDNPYYSLLVEAKQPRVRFGQVVNGCVVKPSTNCVGAQLPGAVLRGAVLDYAQLDRAVMSGAAVALAGFSHASMTGTDLSDTALTGVSFNAVNGTGMSLRGSRLHLGSINNSDLTGADLRGLDANFGAVVGTRLLRAQLQDANLSDTDFNGNDLTGADMTNVNLSNADLTGSTLTGAVLTGATYCNTLMPDGSVKNPQQALCPGQATPPQPGNPIVLPPDNVFYGAINALLNGTQLASGSTVNGCVVQAYTRCPRAHLADASLQGAFLGYAVLDEADLSGSNFYLGSIAFGHAHRARFDRIELGGSSVVDADLSGASFAHSVLNLTNLVGAHLDKASFVGADGRLATFSDADLRSSDFTGADLAQASFIGADLTDARLTGADLTETNLLGANLTRTDLTGATYCNTFMPDGSVKNPSAGPCPGT